MRALIIVLALVVLSFAYIPSFSYTGDLDKLTEDIISHIDAWGASGLNSDQILEKYNMPTDDPYYTEMLSWLNEIYFWDTQVSSKLILNLVS